MTTRPELDLGPHLLPGLVAVALFALLAGAFLAAPMGAQAGFPGTTINETNVTAGLAGGGPLAEGAGTYETSLGAAPTVTVTLEDGTSFEDTITPADVTTERVGTRSYAVVTATDGSRQVTVARLPVVDHADGVAGPGAQVAVVNRSSEGLYAVARRGTITENIGYTMFDMRSIQPLPGESFLIAFEIIDVVLVAALVGAVMLARREPGDELTTALEAEDEDEEGGES